MSIEISETPEKWVIIKIENGEALYKVFGTWAGGYLGSDRWKINSGIVEVKQDENNYYFIGFSGSCYKCNKNSYGTITSFGLGILNNFIEKSNGRVVVLNENQAFETILDFKPH